jgi:hypothetical protein
MHTPRKIGRIGRLARSDNQLCLPIAERERYSGFRRILYQASPLSVLFSVADFDTEHERNPTLAPSHGHIRVAHFFLPFEYPTTTKKPKGPKVEQQGTEDGERAGGNGHFVAFMLHNLQICSAKASNYADSTPSLCCRATHAPQIGVGHPRRTTSTQTAHGSRGRTRLHVPLDPSEDRGRRLECRDRDLRLCPASSRPAG